MSRFYNNAKAYKAKLEARIKVLEPYTKTNPELTLRAFKDRKGSYFRVFNLKTNETKYLSVNETDMIGSLGKKKYAMQVCKILKQNLKAVDKLLQMHSNMEEIDMVELLNPRLRKVVEGFSKDYAKIVKDFEQMKYERNPFNPESLIHKSVRGEMYRSKSECLIADCLYEMGIAYVPEPELKLKSGKTIYPDFMIVLPGTFEIVYWEHFGMMDNEDYAEKACAKLAEYMHNHYYLGKNLIASFEALYCPLSKPNVKKMIQLYIIEAA